LLSVTACDVRWEGVDGTLKTSRIGRVLVAATKPLQGCSDRGVMGQGREPEHANTGVQFTNFASSRDRSSDVTDKDVKAIQVSLPKREGRIVQPPGVCRRNGFSQELGPRKAVPALQIPREDVVPNPVVTVAPHAVP
jgi:hypothetical protein